MESHHCFRVIIIIITPSSPLSAGGVALPPRLSKKERKKERKRREQRRSRGWPPSDTRMPPTCTCLRSARRHAGCVRAAGGHPAEPPNHILPGPRARWTPIDPSTSRRGAVRSGAFPPDRCCLPPHVGLGPPTWRTRKPRAQHPPPSLAWTDGVLGEETQQPIKGRPLSLSPTPTPHHTTCASSFRAVRT